ncbi:MAG: hypothetical protein KBC26_02470 [Candidatus Pacebacteria bacterium]|nr:hypothetical protein [Candidatus Paceibacterota bacterium]
MVTAHVRRALLFFACGSAFVLGHLFLPQSVYAATLSLSPSVAVSHVGDVFTARALINTEGKFINNAEAIITFPTDIVEVVSVSAKNSIFSLWVEQPSFSNASGQISFNGGVVNPGYSGVGGEAISIVFRSKKEGVAHLLLSNVAIRENDGLGTNVLSSFYSTQVVIQGAIKPTPSLGPAVDADEQAARADESLGNGEAPVVSSPTCPDQSAWCSDSSLTFNWELPSHAFAVQTLLGAKPDSVPSVYYSSGINTKKVDTIEDGTWYFHVRYRDASGWSKTAHYRVNIDTTAPTLSLSVKRQGQTNGLHIVSQDTLSGISRYEVVIDGRKQFGIAAHEAQQMILLPGVSTGEHTVAVSAFDNAGNRASKEVVFIAPDPIAPTISLESERVNAREPFVLLGSSLYPRSAVRVAVMPEIGEAIVYDVSTDAAGRFEVTGKSLMSSGVYSISARIVLLDGSLGPESNKVFLIVDTSFEFSIGSLSIALSLWMIVIIIIGVIIVVGGGVYLAHRTRRHKKTHRTAQQRTHEMFDLLIERARHQMKLLEQIRRQDGSASEYTTAMRELDKTLDKLSELFKSKI